MRGHGRFEALELRGQWAFVQLCEEGATNAGPKQWINPAQARAIVPPGAPKKDK
jgi:hypothetical protein